MGRACWLANAWTVAVMALVGVAVRSGEAADEPKRPNIIFILADDK